MAVFYLGVIEPFGTESREERKEIKRTFQIFSLSLKRSLLSLLTEKIKLINMTFKTIHKLILGTTLFLLLTFTSNAQRIAYVDVTRILESITEYQNAQEELDKTASRWRQDIAKEYDVIKGMYNRYQAEQVLLSDEARKQKEEEIMAKEKEVRELQKSRFGPEGALFQQRKELVQPIQDRVYGAIEEYAKDRGFDFIFDKSSSAGMLFSNPEYDKTDDILRKLEKG